eukprot:CAMPEP_0206036760 /NCGR_PEP_ID=MMETSP1466-20131121/2998_1 /ASSEMBLY_ACC=CAM_ASM_001126 /TAXON_ID=44452 /ORGANISM="Pavlova gyrans, Strain CCMP608" /LENGTH=435 /DNA_ID=CAMNT_0053411265 /DNA_START=22 /DNA_END=1329 /DNA_ORIENTATION=+
MAHAASTPTAKATPLLEAHNPRPLADLCIDVIAANFASRPTLRGLPPRFVHRVTALLPTSLSLEVTGPLIDDEIYWKRCATERWSNCEISEHGSSWKRLFFERHLQTFLEDLDPSTQSSEDLVKLLSLSKDYVFSLRLRQFLSHLDLEMIFQNVPTLSHLELSYGVLQIGMDYERSLFGMKSPDVLSLAKALRVTETLTVMALPANQLDDNAVRTLAAGLAVNATVTCLDLSHNKVADRGVKALAKLLSPSSVIVSLDLCDNHVHADGGKYLGRALKVNGSLQALNMRLNRLGDEGGRLLIEGCKHNASLSRLNLSCNAADTEVAQALFTMLPQNGSLTDLDLSGNALDEQAARLVRAAIEANATLRKIDLRLNQAEPDTVAAIDELVKRNELAHLKSLRRAHELGAAAAADAQAGGTGTSRPDSRMGTAAPGGS